MTPEQNFRRFVRENPLTANETDAGWAIREIDRLRDGLLRIAARCESWSAVDTRATVAGLLGCKVEELE